jgi:hypothetical protein
MMSEVWTEENIEFLKQNYHCMTAGEIARYIGCPPRAVYMKAQKLGLRKQPANGKQSIIVICPRCGRRGSLRRHKRGFVIVHSYYPRKESCQFGWTSEYYEELEEAYRRSVKR